MLTLSAAQFWRALNRYGIISWEKIKSWTIFFFVERWMEVLSERVIGSFS